MFAPESVCSMYDDGVHGDGNAGDGVYGGIIDSNNFATNDMIRWYITASDNQGYGSRQPAFVNPLSTAQYFGTIAKDQYLTSNLPILYWYAVKIQLRSTQALGQDAASFITMNFMTMYSSWPEEAHQVLGPRKAIR